MLYSIQGWYIVSYALGIYLLNLFIAFLTPRIDPAVEQDYGKLKICNWFLSYKLYHNFDLFIRKYFCKCFIFSTDEDEDGPTLPTKSDEEFKPFIRRLPEFKFWYDK